MDQLKPFWVLPEAAFRNGDMRDLVYQRAFGLLVSQVVCVIKPKHPETKALRMPRGSQKEQQGP